MIRRRRLRHAAATGVAALTVAVLPASSAGAAVDREPAAPSTRGMSEMMSRMGALMDDGNPGMAQMHAQMSGNPGMARMHEPMMAQDAGMAQMHQSMTPTAPMLGSRADTPHE